jgi:hypothetical protein
MRVNARFDAESQQQLEYLLEVTGLGVSDVLKTSIARYYTEVRAQRAPRLTRLLAHAGTRGSGRRDVSESAKDLLTDAVAGKTGVGDAQARSRRTRDHR